MTVHTLTPQPALPLDLQRTASQRHMQAAEPGAVLMLEVDIARPIPSVLFLDTLTGKRYTHGLLLVRLHTRPIGFIDLETDNFQIPPEALAAIIWNALWLEIQKALAEEGLPVVDSLDAFGLPRTTTPNSLREREALKQNAPLVSIIVCTHNRTDQIGACLDALLRLDYPGGYEIIVVDSAPSTGATAELIAAEYSDDVHYLREDRPGLSFARNRGLEVALGEIIAFTDDDAIVEPNWLLELLRGFHAGENVACVTGLTLPSELETTAQVWLQREHGRRNGFTRRLFDLDQHRASDPLYPFRAPLFGAGVNMAFKAAVLREIGGFDTALGVGTETYSGEDMAALFEAVLRGYQVAYEPGAMVYHDHRKTMAELRQQMHGFGVGFGAYLARAFREDRRLLLHFLGRLPAGVIGALTRRPRTRRPKQIRRGLRRWPPQLWWELQLLVWWGFLRGPFAYRRSRQQVMYPHPPAPFSLR
jgi:glycosyltransferase involved in cell wall biosynthesis